MKQWIKRRALLGRDPPHYFWSCQDLRAIILQLHYKGDPPTTLKSVEHNPRIHDPDDVFPKRLVKITHAGERKSWKKKVFFWWDEKKNFVFNFCENGILVFKQSIT